MRHVLLLVGLLALPALASPNDDAVDSLRSKGIVQGYPGGDYHGRRAATRYEVSELIDRLQRYLESQDQDLAPRSDLQGLQSQSQALQKGLDDLDKRLGPLERSEQNQELRLDER